MKGSPGVIERAQRFAVTHVLSAIEQLGDALGIDLQGVHLIPEALRHCRIGQLELGCRQLPHQQKHQLLLLAFGKAAIKGRLQAGLQTCRHRFNLLRASLFLDTPG
ncbi:MAG: hypothetical protein VKM92_05095 [Cyanobacteriota bacterium]|nr:hypothetical protein [Cyanobacteriota bacterium]